MISPCLPASTPLHACGVDDGTGHRSQSCSRSGSLRPNATGSVLESSEAAAISAIFTSIGVTGSTVSKHSPQSALPVLSPPYSGFPVLHLTLQGERQTQNHPVLVLPRQRSGPD